MAWSADQTIHLLDSKTGVVRKQYPIDAGGGKNLYLAYSVQLSNDGKLLACGSQRSTLVIVETATGKTLHSLKGLPDGVSAIAFSPDNKMLAWGGWNDPRIHLVELATGKLRHTFSGTRGRVLTLSFSPNGKKLLSGSEDTTATVWDLTGGLREPAKMLTAAELEAHWKTLAEVDAAKAFHAMQSLAGSPKEALPYLQQRVDLVPRVPEKELARWIADFDSKDFKTRERASKELDKIGESALGVCAAALAAKPSPEARERLETLLKKRDLWSTPSPETLRIIRALEVLEMLGVEAREVLRALAQGAPGAFVTEQANSALQRSRAR